MSIDELRREMLAVADDLKSRLSRCGTVEERALALAASERRIERLRKAFKRRIDERALYRPGDAWFSTNAREGIEKKLAEVTDEVRSLVRSLVITEDVPDTAGG